MTLAWVCRASFHAQEKHDFACLITACRPSSAHHNLVATSAFTWAANVDNEDPIPGIYITKIVPQHNIICNFRHRIFVCLVDSQAWMTA